MHLEILTPNQIAVLEGLTQVSVLPDFSLAGGTALALRHGHRRSIDFDFFRTNAFDGFGLASDEDIAAMKLEAVAGRGSRKDFVDLRLLCAHGLGLERVFTLFEQNYGTQRIDRYHRLRALTFFEDSEWEPMPDMLLPHDWAETTAYFRTETQRLLAAGLTSG